MHQQWSIVPSLCSILFVARIQQQRHVAQLHSAEAPYECSRCHRRFKSDYRQAANIPCHIFLRQTTIDFNCIGSGTVPTSVYFRSILLRYRWRYSWRLLGAQPVTHLARPREAARLHRGHGLLPSPPPPFGNSPLPPPRSTLLRYSHGTVKKTLKEHYLIFFWNNFRQDEKRKIGKYLSKKY